MPIGLKGLLKRLLPRFVIKTVQIFLSPIDSYYSYKLRRLMLVGKVAIIPVGFRCFTKEYLYPKLRISQASLPFDSGFFSPYSVGKIIKNQQIDLKFNDPSSQTVCIKHENYTDSKLGLGIKFETSTYEEVGHLAISKDQEDINKYLDSTFGYYTLDVKNSYVLAHYNWYRFADVEYSNGHTEPEYNLIKMSELLNRRIQRFINMCEKAEIIFFVYSETQGYHYMAIDDVYYNLNDMEPIILASKSMFKAKPVVVREEDITSPRYLVKMYKESTRF